ncbi:hypothetical protein CBOM_02265 [Ceraceosorus bombacis]|uniref:Uncharacterized protein n=1 Tax=Ceraceosorus bombacis TaxID=401625 RepID=A0A0P1BEP5_9BASI|nr:hypothetical protein CBOM_02265 [Ceraceosorus bombacis]
MLIERTPPKKRVDATPSPAPAPAPALGEARTMHTSSAQSASSVAQSWPSLEDMALPNLMERQQRLDRGIKPTPPKSSSTSTSNTAPSSLSKVTAPIPSSSPWSRRAPERDIGVGASLPSNTARATMAGTPLYPSVNEAAKKAGDLTARMHSSTAKAPEVITAAGAASNTAQADQEGNANACESPSTPRPNGRPASLIPVAKSIARVSSSAQQGSATNAPDESFKDLSMRTDAQASSDLGTSTHAPLITSTSSHSSPARARRSSAKARSSLSTIKSPSSQPIKRSSRLSRLSNQSISTTPRPASATAPKDAKTDEEFLKRLEDAMRMENDANVFVDKRRAEMRKSTRVGTTGSTDADQVESESGRVEKATSGQDLLDAAANANAMAADEEAARRARRSVRASLRNQQANSPEQAEKMSATAPLSSAAIEGQQGAGAGAKKEEDALTVELATPRSKPFTPFKLSSSGANSSPAIAPGSSRRLDPEMRLQRVTNAEIAELRRTLAGREREVEKLQRSLERSKEDADGWKAECEAECAEKAQMCLRVAEMQRKCAEEKRRREEVELDAIEGALERDEMEWKFLAREDVQCENTRRVNIELTICRNEATYQTYRAQDLERDLRLAKKHSRHLRSALEAGGAGDADSATTTARMQEMEKKLKEEKERRRTIARQGMKVEEERNEALTELEEVREELQRAKAKRAEKDDDGCALAELVKVRAKAESEEKLRRELQREVMALKKNATMPPPPPPAIKKDLVHKALAHSSSPPRAARSVRKTPLAMDLSIDSDEEDAQDDSDEDEDARELIAAKASAAPAPPTKESKSVASKGDKSSKAKAGSAADSNGRKQARKPRKRGLYEESSDSDSDSAAPLNNQDSSFAQAEEEQEEDAPRRKRGGAASKTNASSSSALVPAASTTTSSRGTNATRKRKSVEADEERRKALELEIMATPMIKSVRSKSDLSKESQAQAQAQTSNEGKGGNKALSASRNASNINNRPAAIDATNKNRGQETSTVQTRARNQPGVADDGKKKKRKLLGGAAASANGFFAWGSSEGDAISSGLDLPMDISPIKPANAQPLKPLGGSGGDAFKSRR